MHELSIAQNLIGIVAENLIHHPGAQVSSIILSVGTHSGVDPDALRFAFPIAAEGTSVEGADLVIKPVPLTFRCRDCGDSPIDAGIVQCPRCHSINIELKTGTELEISSIELLLPDDKHVHEAQQ